ncbi:unnamed protein product [Diabrotica balteata]|uniref:Uncharacterized protein n=1 Tax=Diabrotica balteata TaxID=107213 RepID=A0A9P0DTU9_DIABA|nr:unnamed protein product [Diabrotica balteata]
MTNNSIMVEHDYHIANQVDETPTNQPSTSRTNSERDGGDKRSNLQKAAEAYAVDQKETAAILERFMAMKESVSEYEQLRLRELDLKELELKWSGFHKRTVEDKSHVTTYGYLPVLPHVSSEYDTVWTVIIKCNEIAKELNNRYTVLTFDQAIYYKAKELQWSQSEDTKNVVIRLGGFHIVMNFLKIIGQFMTDSGLADVWLDSGLYAQSTIDGILSGKKYNKAIQAHKLTRKEDVMQLSDKILTLTRELLTEFPEFIAAQTATGKYWNAYLEMVDILLEFQFSERSGNWEIHLSSFRKMLPYFFAFDHVNYSRWGTIYLMDMYKLHGEAPEVHEECMNENFVVKRLNGNFNQLSVDQALEHINKISKKCRRDRGIDQKQHKIR